MELVSVAPVALLGDRQDRTSALLDSAEVRLVAAAVPVLRLDATRVTRRTMLAGLGSGVGLAIYSGHGTPVGWPTYGGVRPQDLAGAAVEPLDALVLLTCHGASYAQELIDLGVARAVVAARGEVSHDDNVELFNALVAALAGGELTNVDQVMSVVRSVSEVYTVLGQRPGARVEARSRTNGTPTP